ncbi:MAG: hypothetical protein KDM91_13705 [Verrucomicrobiae bacterium]|nr:hypothetical protein [Verrucomicrobiae bacterium]MCP5539162.1 hypothetical protein [Akkermansiaceae bacterium]MCP5549813.1 hypothetical protein [Akkermansiaceae bacterium]
MDFLKSVFTSPAFFGFVGGLVVGLGFFASAVWNHWKTKRELKRYQRHLSDKLEIEAEHVSGLRGKLDELRTENENLRLKVSSGPIQDSAQQLERELEIYARAEKAMVLRAPGFAQAWESAKEAAHEEIREEERGKSLPRRIFRKFFSSTAEPAKQLTVKESEPAAAGAAKPAPTSAEKIETAAETEA